MKYISTLFLLWMSVRSCRQPTSLSLLLRPKAALPFTPPAVHGTRHLVQRRRPQGRADGRGKPAGRLKK